MDYSLQNFEAGAKLYADQLNDMDKQIALNSEIVVIGTKEEKTDGTKILITPVETDLELVTKEKFDELLNKYNNIIALLTNIKNSLDAGSTSSAVDLIESYISGGE